MTDRVKLAERIIAELLVEVKSNASLRDRLRALIPEAAPAARTAVPRRRTRSPGILDPFEVYRRDPGILRTQLQGLTVDQLKDIVAQHGMDRSRLAMKWKSKVRLLDLIVTMVEVRTKKGDAFREGGG
jgi:hypothetical protein